MTQRYLLSPIFLLFFLTGLIGTSVAQNESSKLNQEVEVVKAYKPSVSNADKINLLPEINDTTRFRPDMNYKISSHPVTKGFQSSVVRPYNQFQREISIPGYGKINGGIGNYLTPFLDVYLNNPNATNGTLGLEFNHLSSQGKLDLKGGGENDAPFSYNRAVIFGSYVVNGVTISSELLYRRDMNRFYGYPIAIPEDIMQNAFVKYFNQDQLNQQGHFDLSLKSNAAASSALKFNTGINLAYFNTSTNQVEKAIRVKGDFEYNFGTFSGKLKAGFENFSTEEVTTWTDLPVLSTYKSSWLTIAPSVRFENEFLALEGGISTYSLFEDAYDTTVKLYPKASAEFYTADKKLTFYARMDGFLENNNYSKMAAENRWINPTLLARPTNYLNVFSGGVKGKIALPFAYNIGVKYSKTENYYFYVTRVLNGSGKTNPAPEDLTYDNAFDIEYNNLSILDFNGELSYTTSSLQLQLAGHFYSYELAGLEKAPYMPDFTLQATSDFKLTEKMSATAELFLTGPRNVMLKYYYPPWSSMLGPPPIYLQTDAMVELNLGAKYLFSNNLHFVGKIENLLNRKDEPWYGYTVQGIRFKVGASFSF